MKVEGAGKKSVFKRPWFWIVVVVLVVAVVGGAAGLGGDEDMQGSEFNINIDTVKNGSPEMIPDITYGDAYDNFFANTEWGGFTATTGEDVVEFSGDCTYYEKAARVYIQFVLDESGETFSMYYAKMKVGEEESEMDEQTFIELVYNPFSTYSEEVLGKPLDDDVQAAFEEMYNSYN